MKHVAQAIMVALCVMAVAYCTVQLDVNQKDSSMRKAEVCTQSGGRYDFSWSSCNYEAVK